MIKVISLCFASLLLILSNQYNTTLYGKENDESLSDASPAPVIQILFTGEENGYLEPCGCSEIETGGLRKRQTLINQLRKNNGNSILLSLGDIPDKVGRQGEIKMETTLTALGRMGYTAHNIGEKDINMGPDFLSYLSQISDVDFISSNIVSRNTDVLKIKPSIIKEIETEETTLRVGILGIVSPALIDNGYHEIEVIDPVAALKPLLNNLNNQTDILILLSHAEMGDSIKIAEIYPEFDFIISGHRVDKPELYLKKIKNTYIIPAGEKGKYLGTITLPQKYKQDSGCQHSQSYLPIEKDGYYGLDHKKREPVIEIFSLDDRFEDSPEMAALLKTYQQRLRDEELIKSVLKISPPEDLSFTGNDVCAVCHNKIFKHWETTPHAPAYETLVKAEHEYDPECVECHVIGLNYFTGFETIESTPKLKGVGCESCHGPGSNHQETQSKDYGKVGVENCEICHHDEHSPNFEFKDYWQKIKHPRKEK